MTSVVACTHFDILEVIQSCAPCIAVEAPLWSRAIGEHLAAAEPLEASTSVTDAGEGLLTAQAANPALIWSSPEAPRAAVPIQYTRCPAASGVFRGLVIHRMRPHRVNPSGSLNRRFPALCDALPSAQ